METMQKLRLNPPVHVKANEARSVMAISKSATVQDDISRLVLENFRKTASRKLRTTY